MTTPEPKGWSTSSAIARVCENLSVWKHDRELDRDWSFRRELRTRTKRESEAQKRRALLAQED